MKIVSIALSVLLAAAAPAAACAPEPGKICAGDRAIGEAELVERLSSAAIIILGERHDNPVHHEWQARLIAALSPEGLAFEMVPREKEAAANAARAEGGDLADALDWAESGWPDWALYAPLFAAAPEAEIAGGGVGRDALRLSVKQGAAAAMGPAGARYRLADRLPEAVVEDMIEEQDEAHCDALPAAMLPGMVEAQQLRDASFADAALRLAESGRAPVVLITGNGHARTDRGAPLYLRRAAPAVKTLSVGLVETEGAAASAPLDLVI